MNCDSNSNILSVGFRLLEYMDVDPLSESIYKELKHHILNESFSNEKEVWLTCILALKSVTQGNYGFGCIITDKNNDLVSYANNQVFSPEFRSDYHAEMVALNYLESVIKPADISGYKLFTSLEPCPMCLARILTSGISDVYYAADDKEGGMVHLKQSLPVAWAKIMENRHIAEADCSPFLTEIAKNIFQLNVAELDDKIKKRCE